MQTTQYNIVNTSYFFFFFFSFVGHGLYYYTADVSQRIGRTLSRAFDDRTGGTTDRADERPLVPGGLHGHRVGHVRTGADIHDNGHLRATVAVPVRDDMGNRGPRRVQKQFLPVAERHHRVEHHHRKVHLSVLQMRLHRQRGDGRKHRHASRDQISRCPRPSRAIPTTSNLVFGNRIVRENEFFDFFRRNPKRRFDQLFFTVVARATGRFETTFFKHISDGFRRVPGSIKNP